MGDGMETSAAIYVRRSALDDREGDNRSLGAQERECREWAEREGLDSHFRTSDSAVPRS